MPLGHDANFGSPLWMFERRHGFVNDYQRFVSVSLLPFALHFMAAEYTL